VVAFGGIKKNTLPGFIKGFIYFEAALQETRSIFFLSICLVGIAWLQNALGIISSKTAI
jgi:hypothetical protein